MLTDRAFIEQQADGTFNVRLSSGQERAGFVTEDEARQWASTALTRLHDQQH